MDLTFQTGKQEYKFQETLLLRVRLHGNEKARIQLTEEGHFFYLILQGAGGADYFLCMPVTEFRFAPASLLTEKPEEVWLPEVGKGIQLQLVIYGRKLSKVPLGTYQLRVAYATPRSGFWKELRKTTGKEIIADDPLGPNLDGAFVGAIVSEPVTIKITDASRPK